MLWQVVTASTSAGAAYGSGESVALSRLACPGCECAASMRLPHAMLALSLLRPLAWEGGGVARLVPLPGHLRTARFAPPPLWSYKTSSVIRRPIPVSYTHLTLPTKA